MTVSACQNLNIFVLGARVRHLKKISNLSLLLLRRRRPTATAPYNVGGQPARRCVEIGSELSIDLIVSPVLIVPYSYKARDEDKSLTQG